MLNIKRNIDEVIAMYLLEKELIDIYVEGPTDKYVIENFCEYKELKRVVIEIDDIDLAYAQEIYKDLNLKSNKDKLIALSRLLSENNVTANVKCLVDRDFDGILTNLVVNTHILYTDYSCIESYVFCKKHVKKILEVGIKNFPYGPEIILQEISTVLKGLFTMRLLSKHFNFSYKFPKIDNNISIDKATGICIFDFQSYLDLYINVNRIKDKKDEIQQFVDKINLLMTNDIKFYMNGHDFIEILFTYINKIKNTRNFRLENFESAVYLAIQPNYLDDYDLFKKIAS